MKTPGTASIVCMIGGFFLTASWLTRQPWPFRLPADPPPAAPPPSAVKPVTTPVRASFNAAALPYPGNSMLASDELNAVNVIAKRVVELFQVAEAPLHAVCAQGLRDPDGRLGIFIICPYPFVTPTGARGLDERKTWVVLATLAAAKSSAGCPLKPDYVGLTDPEGMSERWYYELDMIAARGVEYQLTSCAMGVEKAYDAITRSWNRVTAGGAEILAQNPPSPGLASPAR